MKISGIRRPRIRWRHAIVPRITILLFVLPVFLAFEGARAGPWSPERPPVVQVDEQGERRGGPPTRRRGSDGRSRGMGRGPWQDGDVDRLIAVVEDISPEWASSMRSRMAEDPEAAKEDFRRHGRQLFGLVMLKERNPPLYVVRVAELALKRGIRAKATLYHQVLATDPSAAAEIKVQLRELAEESVDLELRARAMELEALDKAVRELRERLMGEVEEREARIEAVWRSLLENDPATVEDDDPFEGWSGRRPAPANENDPAS